MWILESGKESAFIIVAPLIWTSADAGEMHGRAEV